MKNKRKGFCLCECGGEVVGQNNTTIESGGVKFISCFRCFKVWDADYAFSERPIVGIVELCVDKQSDFVKARMIKNILKR